MTESTGKTGRGITFEIEDTSVSPPIYRKIANLTSIGQSGRDAEEIDFTHLESVGGFREFRQGFKDAGTFNLEYHFTPTEASHVDLLARWVSGELFNFRVNYIGAGWNYYETGRGFVKNPSDKTININDPVGGTATVRVSGATSIVPVS